MSFAFTPQWKAAFQLAVQPATLQGHRLLEGDHLLAGLVGMGDTTAAEASAALDITVDAIRDEISNRQYVDGSAVSAIISSAVTISIALGHGYFGSDHLLLALAANHAPVAGSLIDRVYSQWTVSPGGGSSAPVNAYLRGLTLRLQHRFDEAVAVLSQSLSGYRATSAPRTADVEFNLALAYLEGGQPEKAVLALESCVAQYARMQVDDRTEGARHAEAHCHYHLARVSYLAGEVLVAERHYEDAIAFYVWEAGCDGYLARTIEELAALVDSQGQYERAIELLQSAVAAHASNPLTRDGDPSALARQHITEAQQKIRSRFQNAGTWEEFNAGNSALKATGSHYAAENFAEGATTAKAALSHMQTVGEGKYIAEANHWLGICLTRLGADTAQATLACRTAVAVYSEHKLWGGAAQTAAGLGVLNEALRSWRTAHQHYRAAFEMALKGADRTAAALYSTNAARMLTNAGRHSAAADTHATAFRLYSNCGDKRAGDAALEAARSTLKSGTSYDAIKAAYAAASQAYIDGSNRENSVRVDCEFVMQATQLGYLDDAWKTSAEAVRRIEQDNLDPELLKQAKQSMAFVVHQKGEQFFAAGAFDQAAATFLDAAERMAQSGFELGAAYELEKAATALLLAKQFDAAAKYYQEQLTRFGSTLTEDERGKTLKNLGTALHLAGRSGEARAPLDQARSVFEALGAPNLVADVDHSLRALAGTAESTNQGEPLLIAEATKCLDNARAILKTGDAAAAKYTARKAFEIFVGAARWNDAAQALVYFASAERDLGSFDAALELVDGFLGVHGSSLWGASIARLDVVAGTIYYEMRRIDKAQVRLSQALSGFTQQSSHIEAANCHRELAKLHQSIGNTEGETTHFSAAVEEIRKAAAGSDALGPALVESALAQVKAGKYADAEAAIDEAELVSGNDDAVAGRCTAVRAVLLAERGELSKAEAALSRAEQLHLAGGRVDEAAAARSSRAALMVRSGGAHRAVEVLTDALADRSLTDVEQRRAAARTEFHLAVAHLSCGAPEVARRHFASARSRYESLEDWASVDDCQLGLANTEFHEKNYDLAANMFTELMPRIESSGNTPRLAQALLNTGNACRLAQRWGEAEDYFTEARELYYQMGRFNEAAECDLNTARAMGSRGTPYRTVLEQLLPAAIFINSMRLQFPKAPQRVAWKKSVEAAFQQALEACYRAGDAVLTSEIIEFLINSGVYTTAAPSDDESFALHTDDYHAPVAADAPIADNVSSSAAPLMDAGASRLIAGAKLPMTPPPRLIRPDGRMVLSPYVESADHKYTPIYRPAPIRIP